MKIRAPLPQSTVRLRCPRHMPNTSIADSACGAPHKRCLWACTIHSEFLFWHALLACRFLGPLPMEKIGPAPLPCHRAWPRPISPDVVKLRGSFRRTPPMNLAPLARGVVRLVRGVHHDPTAARTPIGHVSRNARLFLDFLFQTVFRPQNPLAWEVLGKN